MYASLPNGKIKGLDPEESHSVNDSKEEVLLGQGIWK